MIYAYTRVSTQKQSTDRQDLIIKEYVEENKMKLDKTYQDIVSGKIKGSMRTSYRRLQEVLKKGDTVIVAEIDRLGRDFVEIQNEYNWYLSNKINLIVIDFEMLNIDFSKENDDGLETQFIKGLLIQVFAYSGQKEREKLSERTKAGIRVARSKGKQIGAKQEYDHKKIVDYYLSDKDISYTDLIDKFDISRGQISYIMKKYNVDTKNKVIMIGEQA